MKKLLLLPLLMLGIFAFDSSAQSRESVIGCWEMPSNAGEHIELMRNGEFSFHDYNAKTKAWDDLTGKWDYKSGKISLMYFDRSKQVFSVKMSGKTMVITKAGGFKMMKTDPSKCGM